MKCMTVTDFRASTMPTAWNNIVAENNTRCRNCHETGAEGFIVSGIEQHFFDVISTNKFYALQFFTYSTTETPFKVVANQAAMTGVSQGIDPHREHPRFDPAQGIAASTAFATRVQARYDANAGTCPPP